MKTTLRDHKKLVEDIQSLNKFEAIKRLRKWLNEQGYEGSETCAHYMIVRTTGKCMSCGTEIAKPVILASNEALSELRRKLSQG